MVVERRLSGEVAHGVLLKYRLLFFGAGALIAAGLGFLSGWECLIFPFAVTLLVVLALHGAALKALFR